MGFRKIEDGIDIAFEFLKIAGGREVKEFYSARKETIRIEISFNSKMARLTCQSSSTRFNAVEVSRMKYHGNIYQENIYRKDGEATSQQ